MRQESFYAIITNILYHHESLLHTVGKWTSSEKLFRLEFLRLCDWLYNEKWPKTKCQIQFEMCSYVTFMLKSAICVRTLIIYNNKNAIHFIGTPKDVFVNLFKFALCFTSKPKAYYVSKAKIWIGQKLDNKSSTYGMIITSTKNFMHFTNYRIFP